MTENRTHKQYNLRNTKTKTETKTKTPERYICLKKKDDFDT